MGYKTCHNLNSSLDSTVCAKDCDRQKKGKFFEECKVSISLSFLFWFWFSKEKGGLWKCCIRRDAAFCHECRWKNSNATILWTGHFLGSVATVHLSKDVKDVYNSLKGLISRFCCTLVLCTFPKMFKWGNSGNTGTSEFDDEVVHFQKHIFIGPESDHWQCLSVTHWLTHSLTNCRLVNLIDVSLACEYGNSKLVEVVDDEKQFTL